MKIVALTMNGVGVRYHAQIQTLHELRIELRAVEIRGLGMQLERVKRQLRVLRRLGYRRYRQRRCERCAAEPLRVQIEREVREALARQGHDFQDQVRIEKVFAGFNSGLLRYFDEQQPDFVFQLGTGLLPAGFVRRSPRILNIHPGILPGIRGMEPLFWAHYYAREDWLGTTLHLIDEGIDTGKPLLRRRVPFSPGDTLIATHARQVLEECEMLRLFFRDSSEELASHDMEGSSVSRYLSQWSVDQFEELKSANWWGAARLENAAG